MNNEKEIYITCSKAEIVSGCVVALGFAFLFFCLWMV